MMGCTGSDFIRQPENLQWRTLPTAMAGTVSVSIISNLYVKLEEEWHNGTGLRGTIEYNI